MTSPNVEQQLIVTSLDNFSVLTLINLFYFFRAIQPALESRASFTPSSLHNGILAQNWHFWQNIGIFGPFGPLPDQKTMQTRCPGGLSIMWVPKLLLSPVKIRNFGQKWHFWPISSQELAKYAFLRTILASSFGALLVGGCGARAVSRKTPIYLMVFQG